MKTVTEILNIYGIKIEKKTGEEILIICPFHQDKNPSLSINEKTGQFQCWSCKESGNLVSFVEKYEHIDRKEAIQKVYGEKNLKLQKFNPIETVEKENDEFLDKYYEVKDLLSLMFYRDKRNLNLRKSLSRLKDDEEFKEILERQRLLKEKIPGYNLMMKRLKFDIICEECENYYIYSNKIYQKFIKLCSEYELKKELRIVLNLLENKNYKLIKIKQESKKAHKIMYDILKEKNKNFNEELDKIFK